MSTLTRLSLAGMAVLTAGSLAFGVSAHRATDTAVQDWQRIWSQHVTDDQVETARRGAEDCTVSLWGPTESDAADVAECVDNAIARAFHARPTTPA